MLRERFFLTAALLTLTTGNTLLGQDKALPCLLSADFESGLPAGWDIGAPVEVVGGSGATADAWRVANASEANSNGFFPVPDLPYDGRFIMANDDAPPCDCSMGSVVLTAPAVDLTAVNGAVLQFRVFHDGNFEGGPALVEASTDGSTWTRVDSIPSVSGTWQQRFIDLSAYDGVAGLQVRFSWSDNGQWASGIALDDICVRGRLNEDLTLVEAFLHDPEPSPFNTNVRSLRYTELPLQQAEALTVAARIRNSGRNTARQLRVNVSITQNGDTQGPFSSAVLDSLVPGAEVLLRVATGWTPTAVGELQISYTVEAQQADEDALDNSAELSMRITGPGWADGYGALASFSGTEDGGSIGEGAFVVLARAELGDEPSTPTGVTITFGGGCTVGTTIRAMLLDAQLSFLDSSARHTLTEEDIQRIGSGEPIFLAFEGVQVSGDVHYGVQSIGSSDRMEVRCSGPVAPGAAVVMEGPFLDVDYITRSPLLRLHFEQVGVGIEEGHGPQDAMMTFQAGNELVVVRKDAQANAELSVLDGAGRLVHVHRVRPGVERVSIPIDQLPAGLFVVNLTSSEGRHAQRITLLPIR